MSPVHNRTFAHTRAAETRVCRGIHASSGDERGTSACLSPASARCCCCCCCWSAAEMLSALRETTRTEQSFSSSSCASTSRSANDSWEPFGPQGRPLLGDGRLIGSGCISRSHADVEASFGTGNSSSFFLWDVMLIRSRLVVPRPRSSSPSSSLSSLSLTAPPTCIQLNVLSESEEELAVLVRSVTGDVGAMGGEDEIFQLLVRPWIVITGEVRMASCIPEDLHIALRAPAAAQPASLPLRFRHESVEGVMLRMMVICSILTLPWGLLRHSLLSALQSVFFKVPCSNAAKCTIAAVTWTHRGANQANSGGSARRAILRRLRSHGRSSLSL